MRRTQTSRLSSDDDASSLMRKTTRSSLKPGDEDTTQHLYQQRYSVYNRLTWETLKAFLESRYPKSQYPNLNFEEQRVGDHWIFETPEVLTEDDKKALEKLRDGNQAKRARSVTPEDEKEQEA